MIYLVTKWNAGDLTRVCSTYDTEEQAREDCLEHDGIYDYRTYYLCQDTIEVDDLISYYTHYN